MNKGTIDICYVISHGFAARMIVQSGLIEQLTQVGYKIAIITPDDNDPGLVNLAENNNNVRLINAHINLSIWDDDYGFKRKYFLEDMDSNPVFWEKHYNSIWYSKSLHPWKRIRPLWYGLVYYFIKWFPSIRTRFKKREGKYLDDNKADNILNQLDPKLVVSSYPINYLESKILYAAKKQSRPTLIHLLSWDNITTKGIFPVTPDYFIAWGQVMYDELLHYYNTNSVNVKICGVPHFDNHVRIRESNPNYTVIKELGLQQNGPYIFVAMSSPRFAPREIDIIEELSRQVNDGEYGDKMQLVIRPHPQNVQGSLADRRWIGRLDNLVNDRVAVDYPELQESQLRWSMKNTDLDRLSILIAGCSICINSGSTVSIDALVMGKPVVLTSFDGEEQLSYWNSSRRLIDYIHLKKLITLGGAEPVYNYSQLQATIRKYVANPDENIENRRFALMQECGLDDGKSTQRVIEAMGYFLELNSLHTYA